MLWTLVCGARPGSRPRACSASTARLVRRAWTSAMSSNTLPPNPCTRKKGRDRDPARKVTTDENGSHAAVRANSANLRMVGA